MFPPPDPPFHQDLLTDHDSGVAIAAPRTVMAQQINHDVVDQSQSMGDASPVDVHANQTIPIIAGNGKTTIDLQNSTQNESSDSQLNATYSENLQHSSVNSLTNGTTAHDASALELDETLHAGLPLSSEIAAFKDMEQDILVNGEVGEPMSIEETVAQAHAVDASGGSDTDTSKADSTEQRDQATSGHVRSNSVKKPLSFKTVSVTKNFLAKSAVVGQASKSTGDKASQGGGLSESRQLTPRPRLVAKSGGGLRDSLPKANKNNGKGPDPAQVWNKNRREETASMPHRHQRDANNASATPPPPPKQFTDEELKQQYGIHMATRLQADENSKESKWADIDDDEDDWAPETVEWIDGTKSMLVPAENQTTPAEEPTSAVVSQETSKDLSKAADASVQRPAMTGSAKTILKPGGGNQAKAGLVLKGIPEAKPSLVAKPAATAPQKSPWAQLPPVEKVSPVQINPQPPPQPQPSRFQQKNTHGFDSMPPQPSPAREIAADDFDRSWRDNERGHRELFDSKSGKYEPVHENRRGSIRYEQGSRQPAVLQRPSQPGHAPPAEPSPAFQTSRSSTQADGMSWGRRRTSSTVSGGSGQIGRRMSISRPQEISAVVDDARRSPSVNGSENVAGRNRMGGGQWTNHQSPGIDKTQLSPAPISVASSADEQPSQAQPPVNHGEDMAELQKRVMREKRELARKRREEEEAKLEAEKRERLRQKLEELGPAPDKKKYQDRHQDRAQQSVARNADQSNVRTGMTQESTVRSGAPEQTNGRLAEPATVTPTEKPSIATHTTIATSPPKPPLPTASGEITQYGSIKLHPPQTLYKSSSADGKLEPKPSPEHLSQPQLSPTIQQIHSQQPSPSSVPLPRAVPAPSIDFSEINLHSSTPQNLSARQQFADLDRSRYIQPPLRERHQVSWNSPHSTRTNHSTWLPSNMAPGGEAWSTRSVPQPIAIGHNSFNNGYRTDAKSPYSPTFGHRNQPHGPGPIAPPNSNSGLTPSQAFEQQPNTLHQGHQSSTSMVTSDATNQTAPSTYRTPKALRSEWENDDGIFVEVSKEQHNSWGFAEKEKYDGALKMYIWRRQRHEGKLAKLDIKEKYVQLQHDLVDREGTTGVVMNISHGANKADTPPNMPAQPNAAPNGPVQSDVQLKTAIQNDAAAAQAPAQNPVPPHLRNMKPRPDPKPVDQSPIGPSQPVHNQLPPHMRNVKSRSTQQIESSLTAQLAGKPMGHNASPLPETASAPPAFTGDNQFRSAQPKVSMPATPPKFSTEHLPQQVQTTGSGRTSRFFPTVVAGDSPPPESTDHPVYDGNTKNPRVNLPKKIVVKLPPTQESASAPIQEPASPTMQKQTHISAGSTPIVKTPSWADRINSLVNKNKLPINAPPQQPVASALNTSTKEPLNDNAQPHAVSVSLPVAERIDYFSDDELVVTSKSTADFLLEDREFGSLPTVKLPKTTNQEQIENPKPMTLLSIYPNSKVNQPRLVDSETSKDFVKAQEGEGANAKQPSVMHVKLPGNEKSIPVTPATNNSANKVDANKNSVTKPAVGGHNSSQPRKKTQWPKVPRRR